MTDESTPRVTVAMPMYNTAQYVEQAINSILEQTYQDLEVVVIDDRSEDQSFSLVQSVFGNDKRVVLASSPAKGIAHSRNEALRLAKGEFLACLDSDDIAHPERLALQVKYLEDHPEVVAVGGQVRLVSPSGELLRLLDLPTTHEEIEQINFSCTANGIIQGSVMMRKQAVISVDGYDPTFPVAQDLDLWLRLGEVGRLANLPDYLLDWRQHGHSAGHRKPEETFHLMYVAVANACQRRGLPIPPQEKAEVKASLKSPAEVYRKWAWWALGVNNVPTARKYALKSLVREPMSKDAWKTVACSLRGY